MGSLVDNTTAAMGPGSYIVCMADGVNVTTAIVDMIQGTDATVNEIYDYMDCASLSNVSDKLYQSLSKSEQVSSISEVCESALRRYFGNFRSLVVPTLTIRIFGFTEWNSSGPGYQFWCISYDSS